VGAGKRISALYLVGHGTAGDGGGFFFAGNPGPGEEFLADLDQGYFDTLDPADAPARSERNAAFIEAVARAAPASGTLNVGFLSCYAAQQGMIQRFGAALRSSPRLASRTGVHVGGYNDYFESRYTPGPGGSTIWTNRVVPSDEVSEEFDPAADATSTPMLIPPYQVEYRDPR
jgi:hypothetical protein